jgi:hypothetical protein
VSVTTLVVPEVYELTIHQTPTSLLYDDGSDYVVEIVATLELDSTYASNNLSQSYSLLMLPYLFSNADVHSENDQGLL